jgi:formylglycine-generating enzyme required for sulfatase activity
VLPVVRPERAAISGEAGLVRALETALQAQGLAYSRAETRAAISGGAQALLPLLAKLADKAWYLRSSADPDAKPPTIVLPIDQGEELFLAEGAAEAESLLAILRDLLAASTPCLIVIVTIRSDAYERLQTAKALDGLMQQALSLPPLPKGAYQDVIEGPAERLKDGPRALKIEPALTEALLVETEAGGSRDALPLLAFTLERLYLEYGGRGSLTLADYVALGRIKGSIEAAVERALAAADKDPRIPRDRGARLQLLRRGFIPWLAGIDPETGNPRRRVARLSEIPPEARPIIDLLKEQHLLATDVAGDNGEITIEPAHEALLRQWGSLQGWLEEDFAALTTLEGVKRAARDWAANAKLSAWLIHSAGRLEDAERLATRPDLAAGLEPTDRAYLAACRKAALIAKRRKWRMQAVIYGLLVSIIAGLVGWINQAFLKEEWTWYVTVRPFAVAKIRPYVLTAAAEQALKPGDSFRECAPEQGKDYCPEMIVVPSGSFLMGSPSTEQGHNSTEEPQHAVTIAKAFAVSKFELTFDEWDTCAAYSGCDPNSADSNWGRGQEPVSSVTWNEAQQYIAWLSKLTGKRYRLLSEAEYEYAARAGTQSAYPWGDVIGTGNADCFGCGSKWDGKQPAPIGSFAPNQFGLYDMAGNVFEMVEDCVHVNYSGAPQDGSAWIAGGDCSHRVIRGGSFNSTPEFLRSAFRGSDAVVIRNSNVGFRIGRTLAP